MWIVTPEMKNFTFLLILFHLPSNCPFQKFLYIVLQPIVAFYRGYSIKYFGVVRKLTDRRADTAIYVINVKCKQDET